MSWRNAALKRRSADSGQGRAGFTAGPTLALS